MDRKIVRIVVILLFVAAIGFGAFKGYSHNKAEKKAKNEAQISFSDMNKEKITSYNVTGDDQVKNILLVGSDKRGSETGYGRSDCMMIASIDTKNNQLKLTSLMGDMYVTIPGYGENKLSMAYSIGGVSLLYETIASNFGIRLDQYAILEFNSFVDVIDKIGGVTLDVDEFEAKYLQEHYSSAAKEVAIGSNKMNGTQALAYVRIRQDAAGDFGRSKRIRNVMKALYLQLNTMSVSDLVPIVTDLLKSTTSDINQDTVRDYLALVIQSGTSSLIEETIPLDDTYTANMKDGVTVYQIDKDKVKENLMDFIYNPVQKKDTNQDEKEG